MDWRPDAAGLATLVALLTEYRQPGANQAQVYARLEQCRGVPDFNNYLAFLLASATARPLE